MDGSWASGPCGDAAASLAQRRPPGDAPCEHPRLRVVDYSRKPPAQLDSGRQFSFLTEDGADRGGIDLGDNEHSQSMTCAHHGWQMK